MVSFKIFFSENNIRRFRTESIPTYEEFIGFLCKQYNSTFHPELRIQYIDSEGDKIDVGSQVEWTEMLEELKGQASIKLYISEVENGVYFKDGPPVEPLYFYDQKQQKISINEGGDLRSRVPKCLQELFPGKRILPYNIPSFLEGILTVSILPNHEVDLDVDITRLGDTLHNKAMEFLDIKEYDKGRDLFSALCILNPQNPVPHYNLACAESLLGNIVESLTALKSAVNLGYNNTEHMRKDTDLDNIRNTEEFAEILNQLEKFKIEIENNDLKTSTEKTISEKEVKGSNESVDIPSNPINENMQNEPQSEALPNSKWALELNILHDIGFFNDDLAMTFLEKNNGSIEKTVLDLLGSSINNL